MLINELLYISPEVWLLTMTLFSLVADLYIPRTKKWMTYALCQITLIGVLCFSVNLRDTVPAMLFNGMFLVDRLALLLKFLLALVGVFVFLYSKNYLLTRQNYYGEYFILGLFSILGMMVLVSAGSLLSLYLGIELLILPLYALITMIKESAEASEAAMKYFVMSALASGLLLYGISLLYGVSGSLILTEISEKLALLASAPPPALLFALVFMIVGLAFKFGAVPFHMWLPDVYQGAPMSTTLFIGTLPKLAAFGFAVRLLINSFSTCQHYWQLLLLLMAALSLIVGNIMAIAQSNLKRLFGYSTIAHVGFIFLGLLTGSSSGFSAALAYLVIYVLMALGSLGIMTLLSQQGFEAENIEDFRGLSSHKPWTACMMMLILLSLSGIPPFAGFYAKLFILEALIKAGYIWLAVLAVLMTVVGAYYYLRVVRVMFFEPATNNKKFGRITTEGVMLLSFNGLTILALGFFPAPLLNLCSMVLLGVS